MKRINLYRLIILISLLSCSTNKVDKLNRAQVVYLYNLEIVHDFINCRDCDFTPNRSFDEAIDFLEKITDIQSFRTMDMAELPWPSIENYLDWKKWYDNNKRKLYWDENQVSIKK